MKTKLHPTKNNPNSSKLFLLILSCSGGAGHIRAAEALHQTALSSNIPIYTEHYNVLDFTSKIFKRLYSESYLQLVNRAPELWGYFYQQSEKYPYKKNGLLKYFDRFNYKEYLLTLQQLKPDAIICTHFLPYISISNLLKKKDINIPIFAATTDFDVHQLWVDPIVQKYFVFHNESAWQLQSKNVPPEKIIVSGIPVMPEFRIREKFNIVRAKLGIKNNFFTMLVLSGGFGIGRVKDVVEHTLNTLSTFPSEKFNILVVCGKNEQVKSEIQNIRFPANAHPYIFGFVANIHELMEASDILISKAGGLTSSEALVKSLPMLIIDPIPGQESRNTDLIVEHGAGWKAINLANLSYKLKQIIENPFLLRNAKKAAHKLAKPDAAIEIINYVYKTVMQQKDSQVEVHAR